MNTRTTVRWPSPQPSQPQRSWGTLWVQPSQPRAAFTLIELTAVLVIMTLLASAVVVSVKPSLDTARRDGAIDRLLANDHRLREQALRNGAAIDVVFDLDRGILQRSEPHERWTILEQGLPLRALLTGAKSYTQGAVRLRYAADGTSPTYALSLGSAAVTPRYLLFIGGSGQTVITTDQAHIDALLSTAFQ